MARVEVDEVELAKLQAGYALLDKAMRNPKTRRDTERVLKQIEPNVQTTEDMAAPYVEQVTKLEKKFDEFLDGFKSEKIDARLNDEFGQLRKSGWTDEGLEKLKKFQIDRSIPSPLDAAAAWERVNPPPKPQTPSSFSPSSWGIGSQDADDSMKLLWKDEDAWAEREAQRVWDEVTSG